MYYISSGEQHKMYTLRTRYIETHDGYLVERDYYIRNLSTNPDKALQVARDLGYEVDKKPEFTLEEIRRRESEKWVRAYEQKRIAEEEQRILKENRQIDAIKNNEFPFGKYQGRNFASASEDYIEYWVKQEPEENETVLRTLVNALRHLFPHILERLERAKGNDQYFGEIKKRYQDLKGEIVGVTGFDGFYGWTNVYQIILETGELAVYMGSAYLSYYDANREVDVFSQVGDKIKFAATIKDHNEYEERKQTKLARILLKQMNGVNIKKGEKVG